MKEILTDRQLLHDRHRLSHEQIDSILGENRAKEFIQGKLTRLASVKHFLDITDLLRASDISFICIKGPLLSYRIYGDASVRFSHDIDLLTDSNSLNRIFQIMLEAHYELTEGMVWSDEKYKQDIICQSTHHLSFFNKELKFCVEIHWKMTDDLPIRKKVVDKLLEQNLTTIDYAGRNFIVLNKEFELTYLMIHGSRHGWSRLKWLVDFKDYPLGNLDLDKWSTLIKYFHSERILGQTNYLLYSYFNIKLPIEGSKRLPDFFIRYAETSLKIPIYIDYSLRTMILWYYRYQWLLFPHIYYKWSIIKSFFSRPGDIEQQNFSSKTAYYLFRPFSLIKRRIFNV